MAAVSVKAGGLSRCTALAFFVSVCAIACCVAKTRTPIAVSGQAALADSSHIRFVHDAGKVVAGQTPEHTFVFRNLTFETLSIQDDTQITRNCGCTTLVPQHKLLQHGQGTEVKVTVNTSRIGGHFSNGGTISWSRAGGSTVETQFAIRGEAVPPITTEPAVLEFTDEEVRLESAKTLRLIENIPIDWSSLEIRTTSKQFTILKRQLTPDGAEIQFALRLNKDVESADGFLIVTALAKPGDLAQSGTLLEARVPLRARQKIALSLRPETVTFRFSGNSVKQATARILVQGEQAEHFPTLIRAMKCGRCQVTWRLLGPKSRNFALLEVVLTTKLEFPAMEWDGQLVVELDGHSAMTLNCVRIDEN